MFSTSAVAQAASESGIWVNAARTDLEPETERALQVLSFFRDVAGDFEPTGSRQSVTAELGAALDDAHANVAAQLRRCVEADFGAMRLVTALRQIGQARADLRDARVLRNSNAMSELQQALETMRLVDTVEDLLAVGSRQVTRLGFDRCLISRLRDGMWLPRRAHVRNDSDLAEAMVSVGTQSPRYVNNELVEADLVRRKAPLLVRDAQRNPRVHPELNKLVRTESYVAAPIIVHNNVIGFIHADARPDGASVEAADRDTLLMFATGFGVAFERIYYQERLRQVYRHVDAVTNAVPDIFEPAELPCAAPRFAVDPAGSHGSALARPSQLLDQLTKREVEVLGYMAAGDTNKKIATRLFVSEATVKAHVKHILRKLGAANRAEAVSRYLRSN